MSDVDKLYQSILAQKMAKVEADKVTKIGRMTGNTEATARLREAQFNADSQQMDDDSFRAKYGNSAALSRNLNRLDQRERENYAGLNRNVSELAGDFINGMAAGGTQLLGGTGQILLKGERELANLFAGNGGNAPDLNDPVNKLSLQAEEALSRATQRIAGKFRENRSSISKVNNALHSEKLAADSARFQQDMEAEDAAGGNYWVTGAKRIGREALNTTQKTLNNPGVLFDTISEQVPSLAIGPASKLGVTAGMVERQTAKEIAKQGFSPKAAVIPESVLATASAKAKDVLNKRAVVAGVGVSEGAGAYQQAAEEILNTPFDALAKQYPGLADALQDPKRKEAARAQLASDVGAGAFAITAPLAGLTSTISMGFNESPFRLAANAARKTPNELVKEAGKDMLKEMAEETLQSGGSQYAVNQSAINEGNVDRTLGEGVGEAAAMGAIGAMGLTSGVSGSQLAARATMDAAGNAVQKFKDNINSVGADAEAFRESNRQRLSATAEEIADYLARRDGQNNQTSSVTQPAAADPMLDPETQTAMGIEAPVEGAKPISRASALFNALNAMHSTPDMSPNQRLVMGMFAMRTSRELRQKAKELYDEAQGMEDGDEKTQLLKRSQGIDSILAHPQMEALETELKKVPSEQLENTIESMVGLLDDPSVLTNPEERQIFEVSKEAILQNPALMSKPLAEALFSKLGDGSLSPELGFTADHAAAAESAIAFHQLSDDVEKSQDWLKGKGALAVTDEIKELGFNHESGYKPSLREYFNDISAAMLNGEPGTATQMLNKLQSFASHMQLKAQAFNKSAEEHLKDLSNQKGIPVNFKTKREESLFANINNEGGRNLIDTIHSDADTVARTYNALLKAHPQLAQQFQPMALVGKPKWRTNGAAPQTNTTTTEAKQEAPKEAAPKQEPKAAENKTDSKTFAQKMRDRAANLTDKELNEQLQKFSKKTDRSPAEEAALTVLREERETRVAAAKEEAKAKAESKQKTAQPEAKAEPEQQVQTEYEDVPLPTEQKSSGKQTFTPKNEEQREGIEKIKAFLENPFSGDGVFVLEGKAGTGKTTIMQAALLDYLKNGGSVHIAAVSHKAKGVLEEKLLGMAADNKISKTAIVAKSMAGLLGLKLDPRSGKFVKDTNQYAEKAIHDAKLIVVDEASMIDGEMLKDILDERPSGTKVIFLGDIGQLAPIKGDGSISPVFTKPYPKHKLLERVRQGEDSSILPYADNYWDNAQSENPKTDPVDTTERRNTSEMEFLQSTSELLKKYVNYFKQAVENKLPNRIKIVAYNNKDGDSQAAHKLRKLENLIRTRIFGENPAEFENGEMIMMTDNFQISKREILENATELMVYSAKPRDFNLSYTLEGERFSIELPGYELEVDDPNGDGKVRLPVLSKQEGVLGQYKKFMDDYAKSIREFENKFSKKAAGGFWRDFYDLKSKFASVAYSYVITSHKAQGSTYDIAVVLEDNFLNARQETKENRSRGLYTAITRASKRVVIVSSGNPNQSAAASAQVVEAEQTTEAPEVNQPVAQEAQEPVVDTPAPTQQELRDQADAINGDERSVNFEEDSPAPAAELNRVLAMDTKEYLGLVNPEGKVTEETSDEAIAAELEDMEAPSDAKDLGKINDDISMKAAGNYLYAVNTNGDVVGVLINTPTGSTFMVHPDSRGQGIGKALMRELITRVPTAQSNGLSPAAEAVRKAVIKDLRAERGITETPMIQKLFSGLFDKLVDGLAGLNQFYQTFKPRKESQSLFHRYDSPLAQFKKAFEDVAKGDDTALNEMFPEGERNRNWTQDQLNGLGQLVVSLAPEVVNTLNQQLLENLKAGKTSSIAKRFAESNESAAKEWSHTNRKTLHVLQIGEDGKAQYHPKIAEAITLSALNWLTQNLGNPNPYNETNNEFTEMFDEALPSELREALKTKYYYTEMVRDIAGDIADILGVTADENASKSAVDGMMKQLAIEGLNALEAVGLVNIQPISIEGLDQVFNFVEVNKQEENDFTKFEYRGIAPIVNQMGTTSFLTKMLFPKSTKLPSVGEKIKSVSQRVRGTGNATSEIQKENLQTMQDVPFTINKSVLKLSNQLGDHWKTLVGYTHGLADMPANETHRKALEGVNQGIDYAHRYMRDYHQQAVDHAKANGSEFDQVAFHFSADVISNGRMMYNGPNPQSSKYLRELLTPNKTTLDMSNKEHTDGFKIAVAQAMGIKTERATWDGVISSLNDMFKAPVYTQLFEDLAALDQLGEGQSNPDLAQRVFQAMQSIGIDSDRGIHALQTYALYLQAAKAGKPAFDTALAFELDGVTDGPINAMVHMGLWQITPGMIRQLRQGGLIIGRSDIKSMNQMGTSIGDMYQNAADALLRELPYTLRKQEGWKRAKTLAAVKLLDRISFAKVSTEKNNSVGFEFTRKMPKHGVMATSYGSGSKAIITQMRDDILDNLYKEISDSLTQGKLLDGELVATIEKIMGKDALPKTLEGYKKFTFSAVAKERLLMTLTGSNEEPGIGKIMVNNIRVQVAPVLASFDLLYKTTAMQTAYLGKLFEQQYTKRHQELVSEGKILPNQALSQKEEERILNQFLDQQPILKTMIARGNGQGVSIGTSDRNGKLWLGAHRMVKRVVDGKTEHTQVRRYEQVTGLNGRLPMDINGKQFTRPGVRAAALFNIALGDATMMSQMFMGQVLNMLNVYDGLEVSVTDILRRGNQVNKAVWNGWQYDALGAAAQAFNDAKIDFNVFSDAELAEMYKDMQLSNEAADVPNVQYGEDGLPADLQKFFQEYAKGTLENLEEKAAKSRAIKKAIRDHYALTDHMAGSMNGHVNQGLDLYDPTLSRAQMDEQIAASINGRALDYLNRSAKTDAAADNLVNDTQSSTEANVEPQAVPDLKSLSGDEITKFVDGLETDKFTRYVLDKIKAVLPEDLVVVHGDPEQINAALAADGHLRVELNDTDTRGVIIGNKIYLSSTKADVVAHELIHAATYGLVRQYFTGKRSALSKAQQKAVEDLLTLTKQFLANKFAEPRLNEFQELLRGHLDKDNNTMAVSEFMAYVLSDRQFRDKAARIKAPDLLVRITKKLIGTVRELLGLPNNPAIASFLEATLGRTEALIKNPNDEVPMGVEHLYHSLGDIEEASTSPQHQAHLTNVIRTVERVMATLPKAKMNLEQSTDSVIAQAAAEMALTKFVQAGFAFNEQEKYAFKMVQQMLYGYLELNPMTMSSLQDLFTSVAPEIKWQDFLENPDEEFVSAVDSSIASHMHDAMYMNTYTDARGRTSQMANFMSLMLVYEPMQKKLAKMYPPKTSINKENMDGFLNSVFNKLMDKLGDMSQKISPNMSQQAVLNTLLNRLAETQEKATARLEKAKNPMLENINDVLTGGRDKVVNYLNGVEVANANSNSKWDKALANISGFGQAALNDDRANAYGSAFVSWLNTLELPETLMKLGSEFVGTTDESADIDRAHSQSKQDVSKLRQRIRQETPTQIRGMFENKLTPAQAKAMHRVIGGTDLQSLVGSFSAQDIKRMMTDSAFLDQTITAWEKRFDGMPNQVHWLREAKHLATYMVHKKNNSTFLQRNAAAIAALATNGKAQSEETIRTATALLDRLVTLYAIQQTSNTDKGLVAELLDSEKDGMERVLHLMRTLNEVEKGKPEQYKQLYNMWKGALPVDIDTRTDLKLANAEDGAKLLKQGYYLVGHYYGDPEDTFNGLAYYATAEDGQKSTFATGGRPTYTQGALQTVQATLSGVDRLTGRTIATDVQTMITSPKLVAQITMMKNRYAGSNNGLNLLPVRDDKGMIVAYERPLDQGLLRHHLKIKEDLPESIGIWMGRQAEEALARKFNSHVVDLLYKNWKDAERQGRTNEFVTVNAAIDPVSKDTWGSVPKEIQEVLLKKFDGRVMVRKTNKDNAFGYRQASISDIFSGNTNLPKPIVDAMYKTATGIFGKNAYKVLVNSERVWTGVINHAKDWILIRSGTVVVANALANQFQMLQMGVPAQRILPAQAVKVKETLQYFRNEMRQAQLTVMVLSEKDKRKRDLLIREEQQLSDSNRRLSIWPLIAAGELQTIAEGMSEQDQYTLLADAEKWLENKMKGLPGPLNTFARYAVVAEDTAIHKAFNRMMQMGDFVAKAVVYDHLLESGMDPEVAMREVSETFVNYTRNAGRMRDVGDRFGLTWFLNYKIRIQKVVLRNIRKNPFQFLAGGVAAEMVNSDSLWSSSGPNTRWGSAFGLGQFWRAHTMNFWNQLFK